MLTQVTGEMSRRKVSELVQYWETRRKNLRISVEEIADIFRNETNSDCARDLVNAFACDRLRNYNAGIASYYAKAIRQRISLVVC